MISNWLAAALGRRNIHYGWVMVGVTFLTALISAGTVGAPGVFIVPLQKEFGWSTAEISSALSIRFILFGLMAPFAAALLNRYGLRNVTLTAQLIVVSALVLSLGMTEVWQLVAAVGRRDRHRHRHDRAGAGRHHRDALVRGAARPRRRHHDRERRHRPARVPAAAGKPRPNVSAGGLRSASSASRSVFPPSRCCSRCATARAIWACARSATKAPSPCPPRRSAMARSPASRSARCATPRRRSAFWILFATFFVCGASTNGLVQVHLIPMCLDFGIPQVQAAGLLAAMGIFDFFGTIMSGWLSDRYDNRYLLFWYYGLRGLSLIFLPFSDFSFYGLSIFAMFYGLDWIATVPPTVRLTAQKFGPERANLVFGWIFAGHQLGAGTAAFGAGFSRTVYQSYLPAFFIAGALCVFASLIVLTLSRQPKPKPQAAMA